MTIPVVFNPPTGFSVVTVASIGTGSFLNKPQYIANAGGAANNISTDDQFVWNNQGGTLVFDDQGNWSLTGGASLTENLEVEWFYAEAQEGYITSPMATLTILVTADIVSQLGLIANSSTLYPITGYVPSLDPVVSQLGNIVHTSTLYPIMAVANNGSPVVSTLGAIVNTITLFPITITAASPTITNNGTPASITLKSGESIDLNQYVNNPMFIPLSFTFRSGVAVQTGVNLTTQGVLSFNGINYATVPVVVDVNML